jgi:hypothetical protein
MDALERAFWFYGTAFLIVGMFACAIWHGIACEIGVRKIQANCDAIRARIHQKLNRCDVLVDLIRQKVRRR